MWGAYITLLLILAVAIIITVRTGKLTLQAGITGGIASLLIFAGSGYTGIAQLAAFFILGTAATSWKHSFKAELGVEEKNKGRRTSGQVLANAGIAAILGLCCIVWLQQKPLFCLMIAAAFSAATADTLSSELGNIYGSRFYNITTLKKDSRGLNGVVSLEGTLCGLSGSSIIALIYAAGYGWSLHFIWIILAGTAGNLADSFLGATLERKGTLGNNAVNFLNTLTGALVAFLLSFIG